MTKKHEISFVRSSVAEYLTFVAAVNRHPKRIFVGHELDEEAVIKHYLTTAADGKNYLVKHYNLQAIIAVGFKIENERAESEFEKYRIVQDRLFESDFDRLVKQLEQDGKKIKGGSE